MIKHLIAFLLAAAAAIVIALLLPFPEFRFVVIVLGGMVGASCLGAGLVRLAWMMDRCKW